ncbi:MAG: hypothetical protein ACR2L3_02805 [Actinomycetota bacterium]
MSKGSKDLLVILFMAAIVIAGFYIVLRQGINFEEVPSENRETQAPRD